MVDIANEQQRQGHKVAIIIINRDVEQSIVNRISAGVSTFLLKRVSGSKSVFSFLKLFFILRFKFKANVIHCHDLNLGKLLKAFTKVPLMYTIHGPGIEVAPMKYFQKLFAISNSIKADIEGRSKLKCRVIYNGITTALVEKREIPFPQKFFKIVQVKRLNHERKGQDLLIKAAHELIHKQGVDKLKFYIIGEGDSKVYLEQMIKDYELDNNVIMEGNKSREWIYKNLSKYDLFVHPSRFEGFGLTVVEAMAAKVPVVASNIEGPAEILNHGEYGILFENGNVEDLVAKIKDAISLYQNNKMNEIVESAYQHCIHNFDISKTARNYCESYFAE